jgi:hypothetical protein
MAFIVKKIPLHKYQTVMIKQEESVCNSRREGGGAKWSGGGGGVPREGGL